MIKIYRKTATIKAERFDHENETIATFRTYEKADEFIDAAADYPDWWTVPVMIIVEVNDDEK